MMGTAKKVGAWAMGLAVVGALAFGSTVAFATSANAATCADDGWNFLGQQPSEFACVSACYQVHGEELYDVLWGPINGCCRCLF